MGKINLNSDVIYGYCLCMCVNYLSYQRVENGISVAARENFQRRISFWVISKCVEFLLFWKLRIESPNCNWFLSMKIILKPQQRFFCVLENKSFEFGWTKKNTSSLCYSSYRWKRMKFHLEIESTKNANETHSFCSI